MNAVSGSPLVSVADFIRTQTGSEGVNRPILLVGGIGAGKTAAGLRLLSLLRSYNVDVGGVLAPRILKDNETVGYSLIDLSTNATHPFASLVPAEISIGKYYISREAMDRAERIIASATGRDAVIFVDEVGRLELGGGGHAVAVRRLLSSTRVSVLLVRDTFVEPVLSSFGINDPYIVQATALRDTADLAPGGAQTFWGIIDAIPYPMLITYCFEDGFPQSRPMHLIDRDRRTLWFATSRSSRKVQQIQADSRVTVLFVDSARYNYAAVHGRASLVDDAERQRTLWRNEWEDDWPEGPSDPDYILIRVDGVRGHFLRGYTGESGEIEIS
jgi:general stress protein 26/nucleoside-triphosphatase THEP1